MDDLDVLLRVHHLLLGEGWMSLRVRRQMRLVLVSVLLIVHLLCVADAEASDDAYGQKHEKEEPAVGEEQEDKAHEGSDPRDDGQFFVIVTGATAK